MSELPKTLDAGIGAAETAREDGTGARAAMPHGKTTGEKYFGVLNFVMAWVGTFVISVWCGYASRYGEGAINGNIKKAYEWCRGKVQHNPIKPLSFSVADDAAMTTALMMGGNAFLIPIEAVQERAPKVVAYFNRLFGKPGEVEEGNRNVQAEPKQGWASLLKGRVVAWLTVFSAFTVAGRFAGTQLKAFEEGTGAFFKNTAEWFRSLHAEKWANLGRISALDAVATTASVTLLFTASRFFAAAGARKKARGGEMEAIIGAPPSELPQVPLSTKPAPQYANVEKSDAALLAQHERKQHRPVGSYVNLALRAEDAPGMAV